jgi:two-component system, LuxR family, response regulator FixJ
MAREIYVHVVEDDQPMRDSLVALVEESGYRARPYAAAEDFLSLGPAAQPGCVVSDVRMPGMDGLTLLRRLRSGGSTLPLILITGHGDIAMAVAAMKAGAIDFIEKPFEAETLLGSIEAALQPRGSDVDAEEAEEARRRLGQLTSREYEVLHHIVSGKSSKEAALSLGISPRTVESHRSHIMEKTSAKGLAELVRLWMGGRRRSATRE